MNTRQARRMVRRDIVDYARCRAACPGEFGSAEQRQIVVNAWTWLAEWLTPRRDDPDDPDPDPILCRPDGTHLEETMPAKPLSSIRRAMPDGTLAELREFIEATKGEPGHAKIRVVTRLGRGSTAGSQPRDITAEVYPQSESDGDQA